MPLRLNLGSSSDAHPPPPLLERLRPLAASAVNRLYYGAERHYLESKHRLSSLRVFSPPPSTAPNTHPNGETKPDSNPEMATLPTQTHTAPGIAVHTMYPPSCPPPHPGRDLWTRFVCLSDTHTKVFPVPDGDVLLHSGDLSQLGRFPDLKPTMDWLCALPHPKKVVIAGNHDLTLDKEWYDQAWNSFHRVKENPDACRALMKNDAAGLIYLEYEEATVQAKPGGRHWKIYGSPGSPWFGGWAYNYERGAQAAEIHARIPDDTDILLTHGPPLNTLDKTNRHDAVGCAELSVRVEQIRPTLHLFGHIHEDRGVEIVDWPAVEGPAGLSGRSRTVFVNGANTPSGAKANDVLRTGLVHGRLSTGGPGFQPIIVDLYDPVDGPSASATVNDV